MNNGGTILLQCLAFALARRIVLPSPDQKKRYLAFDISVSDTSDGMRAILPG